MTLSSRDGSVVVSGTLLTFDGELYRIASEFGELTLDIDLVRTVKKDEVIHVITTDA